MINKIILKANKTKNKIKNGIFCHTQLKSIMTCDLATNLPKSTKIPHPYGIVIGYHVKIGNNCTI